MCELAPHNVISRINWFQATVGRLLPPSHLTQIDLSDVTVICAPKYYVATYVATVQSGYRRWDPQNCVIVSSACS